MTIYKFAVNKTKWHRVKFSTKATRKQFSEWIKRKGKSIQARKGLNNLINQMYFLPFSLFLIHHACNVFFGCNFGVMAVYFFSVGTIFPSIYSQFSSFFHFSLSCVFTLFDVVLLILSQPFNFQVKNRNSTLSLFSNNVLFVSSSLSNYFTLPP